MPEPAYAFDAFISYRRQEPDKQFARELLRSLQAKGYQVAFDEITFSPQASFLEEMERCVRQSRFVLAVVSPQYFDSGNTQEEAILTKVMDMAERKRRLIPLMIEEVELPYWLYNLVGIHFTDPDPLIPLLDRVFSALGSPAQAGQNIFTAAFDEVCPYQGLEAFTPETRQFFYGRQQAIDALVQKLNEANFVPLIGASGSGKSSVVRAGLVPQLQAQGWRVLEPIKPGVKPMAALQEALGQLFAEREDWPQVYALLETEGIERVLLPQGEDGLDPPELPEASTARLLLVIDQFEEVFTVCPSESERRLFIQRIAEISQRPGLPLAIVTTMRADFVEPWLGYGALIEVIQQQAVWLGPLAGQNLVDAIVQPAEQQGYRLGEGLLQLILADVAEERNCLPLLEFALKELWETRVVEQRVLPTAAYGAMGRLMGALNTRADHIYTSLKAPQQIWAQRICLKLVRTGQDAKDTRQRQPLKTLLSLGADAAEQKTIWRVISALVAGRLLIADEGEVIDLAHEALMTGWETFAEWRQQDRDLRRLVQRVEDEEKEWRQKKQDERYLLQGGLLAEIREQWETVQAELTPDSRKFYQQSDEQEKEQVAFLERALAESELREQALKVMNLTSARPMEAAATAIQSAGISDQKLKGRIIAPVKGGLYTVIDRVREWQRCQGHESSVLSVAFSPDGQTIVSGSDDRTIRLWDVAGNPIGQPFQGHEASVLSVAFSPDGQTIVSGSADRTIRLWRGGTWRDWLALCCNRFRYHPLFKNPTQEPFISACKVCEEYVWSQADDQDA